MATRKRGTGVAIDLGAALSGMVPPAASPEVTAGFFHRTLARWLGLPEGRQPGRKAAAPPLWDYDFWKAELVRDADAAIGGDSRQAYTARLHRSPVGPPDVVRYWVKLDGGGRIRASGWLTPPPDLLAEAEGFARLVPAPPTPADVAALVDAD